MSSTTSTYADELDGAAGAPLTVVELLRRRAVRGRDKLAYTFLPDGDEAEARLTYGELDAQARAVAACLRPLVKTGERVLLLYPPGLEYLAAFFGCLYIGAVGVPAYPPRRSRGLLRLQAIIADADASVVLTTTPVLSKATTAFAQNPYLKSLRWLATDALQADAAEAESVGEWAETAVSADDLTFLQYTSGSTGRPKGVMLTHANLLHNARLVYHACEHGPGDSYVSWLPTFHDMGFMAGILQPLYGGFPVVQMSPTSFLQSPLRWLRAVTQYRATTSGGPNFAYDLCVRKVTPEQREQLDLSSWTVAFNGAEPVRAQTLERFAETFAPCGFRREAFYPCYGLAEATLMVSGSRKGAPPVLKTVRAAALERNQAEEAAPGEEDTRTLVGCGTTQLEQRIVIAHTETLARCADGEVGEIWVAGGSVARGYWNNPEETEHTFGARLSDTGEGPFLRTGDLGFLLEGELFVTGRHKDLIIIRGLNHYPQDIELTVEQAHPAVRPGCVAAFSTEVAGEERLVVVQEVDSRQSPDLPTVIEAIRRAVSEEHDLQTYAVALVRHGTILKTSSGKIMRRAIRRAFLESSLELVAEWRANVPAAGEAQPAGEAELTPEAAADVSAVEAWLQRRLAAKLNVRPEEIDVRRPVTHYGLDSLLVVELKHEVEELLGIDLPFVSFFETPSLRELADAVATRLAEASAPAKGIGASAAPDAAADCPLSRGQQALWFLHRLAPDSAAYNISRAVRVLAPLDVELLRQSFQSLVDRHPSLRTTFHESTGGPVQRVHDHMEVSFQVEDASAWGEEALDERLDEEANRPFNLAAGPLLRVQLFRRSGQEHCMLLSVHHIVADFWSLSVLMHELGVFYEHALAATTVTLPPLTLRYTDYIRWQEEMLAGEEGAKLDAYWREQLADAPPVLELPTDHPRPPVQTYRGASHGFRIEAELVERLRAAGHRHGATLYMTLLAAFQTLLRRYTGQDEITVGSPTAGRKWAALSGVVGYFVNPVVLRTRFRREETFDTLLAEVRRNVLAAFEHQEYPFPLLVERLQPQRDPSRSPLFQVMFVMQKARLLDEGNLAALALGEAGARVKLGSLALEALPLEQRVAQFDLTLYVTEHDGGLAAQFEYNADLYEADTVARLSAHFLQLLDSALASPSSPLARLPLLTPTELDALAAWNAASAAHHYPAGLCLHQLFERQAALTPGDPALVCEGERLSYRELNERANRLAHYLRALGVGPEVRVGLLMERTTELVVSLLAVLKAGGAYVPLDPQYPPDRLAFMLADAGISLLLTQRSLAAKARAGAARVIAVEAEREAVAHESTENPRSGVTAGNLAYVIYTSGSTGRPKGVAITHHSASLLLHWAGDTFSRRHLSGVLASTSVCFDLSVFELFAPLCWGGRVILAETALHLPRLEARDEVRLVNTVPSAMAQLLRLEGGLPEGVEVVNLAGEALPRSLVEALYARVHVREVWNLYGPSEDTTYSTAELVSRGEGGAPAIGRGVAGTRLYILDAAGAQAPVGVPGELYIGGEGLARCYLNRPELTAERFVPDPYGGEAGARLYRTGDVCRWLRDGRVEYLGRADQQVKVRGYRIELGEIESVLAGHPSVRECVVVVWEASAGDKRIVAYVIPRPGVEVKGHQLRAHAREQLPDYMVPSVFVLLDSLPLTPNGKVDRKALPAPEQERPELEQGFVMPEEGLEQVVASIWQEVLGVERVGVNDNFFDLGGHSLLLVQVQDKLRERLGRGVGVLELFKSPTVRTLAASLAGDGSTDGGGDGKADGDARGNGGGVVHRADEEAAVKLSEGKNRLRRLLKREREAARGGADAHE